MSGQIWLPQWKRVDLGGPDGDPYHSGLNIKLLWHRWESNSWTAAENAFRNYPPHCAAKIGDHVRQYVPLDEHAYALAGSQNEAEFVIQVEVAGFSHDTRDMTYEEKEWLAKNVLEPILFFHDVPDIHPTFYDDRDGFTLASSTAPQRFSSTHWHLFSGHVGHQHAPAPDRHWDPGKLDIDTIVRVARRNGNIIQSKRELDMVVGQCRDKAPEGSDGGPNRKWFFYVGKDLALWARVPTSKVAYTRLGGIWTSGVQAYCESDGRIVVSGRAADGQIQQCIVYTDGNTVKPAGTKPEFELLGGEVYPPN